MQGGLTLEPWQRHKAVDVDAVLVHVPFMEGRSGQRRRTEDILIKFHEPARTASLPAQVFSAGIYYCTEDARK